MPDSIVKQHMTGLGGTGASALMGFSPFSDCHRVYAECLGIAPKIQATDAMAVGNWNEPFIRKWYEKQTGMKGGPLFIRHPKIDWMLGNLDWISEDRKHFAEFKVAGLHSWHEWGDPEKQQIPQGYYFQGLHYAMLTGIKAWDFVVMIGTELRIYPQVWNESLAGRLYEVEKNFWENHVLKKVPPPIDASESCKHLLAWMWPENEDDEIRLPKTDAEAAALAQLAECKENLEAEQGNYDQMCNTVKAMLGNDCGMESDRCKVTWKANKKGVRVFLVKPKESTNVE